MQGSGNDERGDAMTEAPDALLRDAEEEYSKQPLSDEAYDEILGILIRRERTARGMTAEAAAEKAHLAYKTYLRVENGKSVRYTTWRHIENLFGLAPNSLMAARTTHEPPLEVVPILSASRPDSTPNKRTIIGNARSSLGPLASSARATFAPAARDIDLRSRLAGLTVEELRRLSDMIEGALFTLERPEVDRAVAEAAVRLAESDHAAEALRHHVLMLTEEFTRAESRDDIPINELRRIRFELERFRAEQQFSDVRREAARRDYETLRQRQLSLTAKAEEYLRSLDDAEHGEAAER
jgi:transcriptional regulator with XRE-family HTH domain